MNTSPAPQKNEKTASTETAVVEEEPTRKTSDSSVKSIMRPTTGRRPSTGKSVRFHGSHTQEMSIEDKEELIKKLENPHSHRSMSSSDEDLSSVGAAPPRYPRGSPPPYMEDLERINSPSAEQAAGSSQLVKRGSLQEAVGKLQQKFVNLMKADPGSELSSEEELERSELERDENWVVEQTDMHRSDSIMVKPIMQLPTMEFYPSVGDIDAFVKVPRPDEIEDNAGLTQIDEPSVKQSDPTIVDMQMRSANKEVTTQENAPVKRLHRGDKEKEQIDRWIKNVKELHRNQVPPTVNFKGPVPDIEKLMQALPEEVEKKLENKEAKLPSAKMDVTVETFADLACNLVDIPVGASRIQALHQLFALFMEFKKSQHFKNLDHNRAQQARQQQGEKSTERLEL